MNVFPKLMLWAWERPEDLRSLDPAKVGVAYLCQTLTVHGDQLVRAPRLQPLRIPAATKLMAVTRIEVDHTKGLKPSTTLRDQIIGIVLHELRPGVKGIQLDFDAKASERSFYADLLRELRRRMDPNMPLSMTALASWALFDDWIKGLPVDEAVPMCFDMGADTEFVRRRLASHQDFHDDLARRATGVAIQQPLPWIPRGLFHRRRVYVFNHRPWDEHTLHDTFLRF
ncbi:MAG: hypothetical protein IPP78_03085 [Holophagaceae bacterium]|nr:hypothetical protein [Holophagaceae bacterium]